MIIVRFTRNNQSLTILRVIVGVDDVHRHRWVVDVSLVDAAAASCSRVPVIDSVNIHNRHVAVHPTCAAAGLVAVVVDRLRGGEIAAVHRRVHRLDRGGVVVEAIGLGL